MIKFRHEKRLASSSDSPYSTCDKIHELYNFVVFVKIEICVTRCQDFFSIKRYKKKSQLSYTLLGNVDEISASILDNIKEMYPKLGNSLKLQLRLFHSTHRVNDE